MTSPLPFALDSLPFALESLPFTSHSANSVQDLFVDHGLPMRAHRRDLLAKLLDRTLETDMFAPVEKSSSIENGDAQRGEDTNA